MSQGVHDKHIIGRVAWVGLPELGIGRMYARVDTGAHHNTMHCSSIGPVKEGVLSFTISDTEKTHYGKRKIDPTNVSTSDFEEVEIRTSSGHEQKRYVVPFDILVQGKLYKRELFTLSDRTNMVFPVLLGRRFLKGRYLVDVESMLVRSKKEAKK